MRQVDNSHPTLHLELTPVMLGPGIFDQPAVDGVVAYSATRL